MVLDDRFRKVQAHIGGTAKVGIGVEGEPAPSVSWFKDNAPLRAKSNVVVDVSETATTIVMKRMTREDAGDYELVAKNDWGTTKERFTVKVVGTLFSLFTTVIIMVNPLMGRGNYSATSTNIKLVHWLLIGGLLHLVQRGGDCAGPQPAQAPPRCTKCSSPPINGQCTNHRQSYL